MTPAPGSPDDLAPSSTQEQLVKAFECALWRREQPRLEDYLAGELALPQLIRIDMVFRLNTGIGVRVEEYLASHPRLTDTATILDLLTLEYRLRLRQGESPSLEEYQLRFPHLAGDLAKKLERLSTMDVGHEPPRWATHFPGTPTVPGYELLAELGRGGMGVVYKARQVKLNRIVALKVIRESAGLRENARLRVEAEATAQLLHPNIVQIHEIGEHEGALFLSLEFCAGGSLEEALAGTPLPARDAARLIQTLAHAVAAAHQSGIIHRDLKPGNVLLQKLATENTENTERKKNIGTLSSVPSVFSVANFTPKISDFGLAKRMNVVGQTTTGAVVGTASYMPPEQALGMKSVGPAADIYALGAILYECLTGRPPFKAATMYETLNQVVQDDPVRPTNLQSRVPRDLETICLTCLQKDPQKRYHSALAFADDLRRFLAGESIRARPPSLWGRGVRWVRRNRALALLFLLIGLIAVALPLGLLAHLFRVEGALSRARSGEEANWLHRYASDVRLADQLLRDGDLFSSASLLHRHLPEVTRFDRRGFEWHHLERFCQIPSPEWRVHQHAPVFLAFTPDGRALLTASNEESHLCCWDVHSRQLLWDATAPFRGPNQAPGLALSANGALFARIPQPRFSTATSAVSLHEPRTGREVGQVPIAEAASLALSADGRMLAAWARQRLSIWNVEDTARARLLVELPGVFTQGWACAFSWDDRVLAFANGSQVHLWHTATWEPFAAITMPGAQPARNLAFCPQRPLVAVASGNELLLYDVQGTRLIHTFTVGQADAQAVAFSPDGLRLACGNSAGDLYVWDMDSRQLIRRLHWQPQGLTSLAFAPGGRELAAANDVGVVQMLDTGSITRAGERLRPALTASGALAFCPGGQSLAVATQPSGFVLLDAASLEVRCRVSEGLARVARLLVVPTAAGRDSHLVATNEEGCATVVLRDAKGTPVQRLRAGLEAVESMAVTAAGDCLAVATADGLVRFWDPCTAVIRQQIRVPECKATVFSPDGKTLATGSRGGVLRLWRQQAEQPHHVERTSSEVVALAYSPDGSLLASGHADSTVRLWHTGVEKEALAPVARPLEIPAERIRSLLLTAQKQLLVCTEERVHCWQTSGMQKCWHLPQEGASPSTWQALACSADGRQFAATTLDGCVRVWEQKQGRIHDCLRRPVGCIGGPVVSLAFADDGQTLITGSEGPAWKTRDCYRFLGLATENDRRVMSCSRDGIHIWDLRTRKERPGPPGQGTFSCPGIIAISPDARTLAAGGDDGQIWIHDEQKGQRVARLFVSPQAERAVTFRDLVSSLARDTPSTFEGTRTLRFSPSGRWLSSVSTHGVLTLWDTSCWTAKWTLAADQGETSWATFGPDDVVLRSTRGQLQWLDPHDGSSRGRLGSPENSPICCVALSEDGQLVAAATEDRRIHLWDFGAGEQKVLVGHANRVTGLAFHRDSRTLASCSWDRTVRLWSVAAGQEMAKLEQHQGKVLCLSFTPDGRTLVSGGRTPTGAGEVILWRTP